MLKKKKRKGKNATTSQELNIEKHLKGRIHGKASRAVKIELWTIWIKSYRTRENNW